MVMGSFTASGPWDIIVACSQEGTLPPVFVNGAVQLIKVDNLH
jgi:hypothetical protein